jgi:hypothetical protein
VVGDWWAVAGTWSCVINVKDSTSRELFVRTWNYLCCVVVLTVILQPIITCEKLMTHPTYMPKQSSKKLHMGHHPIPSSNTHTHTQSPDPLACCDQSDQAPPDNYLDGVSSLTDVGPCVSRTTTKYYNICDIWEWCF